MGNCYISKSKGFGLGDGWAGGVLVCRKGFVVPPKGSGLGFCRKGLLFCGLCSGGLTNGLKVDASG